MDVSKSFRQQSTLCSRRLFTAVALALACSLAPTHALCDPIRVEEGADLRSDSRLQEPVTITRPRIYLGELCERLSSRQGVTLRVDDHQGPVSGISLVVRIKDRPLSAVMNAVTALLSSKFDQWQWQASKSGGYTLYHQVTPEAKAKRAQAEIVGQWAADVRAYYAIARGTPSARSAAAAKRPDLFPQGTLESGKPELIASLAPDELERILQGGPIALELSGLTPAARQAMNLGVSGLPPLEVGRSKPAFFVRWLDKNVGPTLWVRNSHGISANLVGGSGWDDAWFQSRKDGWRYPGAAEAEDQRRRMADRDFTVGMPSGEKSTVEWLYREAERQKWDLIADPVHPRLEQIAHAWHGLTSEQAINALIVRGRLAWKRSNGIHLFREQTDAVQPRRHLVSWSQIRSLRQVCSENEGYLTIDKLIEASRLNEAQLTSLREEFPDLSFAELRAWSPLFRFYEQLVPERRERLASTEGLLLRDAGITAREALRLRMDEVDAELLAARSASGIRGRAKSPVFVRAVEALRDGLEGKRLRFTQERAGGKSDESDRRVRLEVTNGADPVVVSTFDLRRRKPLQPER